MTLARRPLETLPGFERRPAHRVDPEELHHRFSLAEIAEAAAMTRIDMQFMSEMRVTRAEWCKAIGRDPRHKPDGDLVAHVIWTLERGLLERHLAQERMPAAPSRTARSRRRRR